MRLGQWHSKAFETYVWCSPVHAHSGSRYDKGPILILTYNLCVWYHAILCITRCLSHNPVSSNYKRNLIVAGDLGVNMGGALQA